MKDINEIRLALKQFAEDRDWDKFHSPKNLIMALSVETAELMEHFQWLTEKQSSELDSDTKSRAEEEIADILLYLIRLADKLGIDIITAASKKLVKNNEKYPAEKVRGSSRKYSDYVKDRDNA